MNEIIVRLARTVASRPRLLILSRLAGCAEATPSELGHILGMPLNALSFHLRAMVVSGLVSTRRAGAKCYYRFDSPYPARALSGAASRLLKDLLQPGEGRKHGGVDAGGTLAAKEKEREVHGVVFDAVTAFTDARRIRLLVFLHQHGEAEIPKVRQRLKMSSAAMCRHLSKLERRGVVSKGRSGTMARVVRISKPQKSPIHEHLLKMVLKALDKADD